MYLLYWHANTCNALPTYLPTYLYADQQSKGLQYYQYIFAYQTPKFCRVKPTITSVEQRNVYTVLK